MTHREKAVPHGADPPRRDARTDTRIRRKAVSSLRRGVLLHRSNDIRLEQENVRLSSVKSNGRSATAATSYNGRSAGSAKPLVQLMRGRVPGGSSSHALHPGKFGFSSSAQNEAESACMQSVAISRNQSQSVALRVHAACNQCNQGASALTCQGVAHARVEEAGLLRTCGEAGRGAVVSTRMRALKRRVCCAPPTSVYRSRRISGSVSSTTRASYLHAISRNQSQSVAISRNQRRISGREIAPSRVGRTAEIGAPAGSIMGNQGRSHLGDRTLASAGRTAEIGAPAGSTAVTRASAEPAAALAPS